jgi:prophage regulatory protein
MRRKPQEAERHPAEERTSLLRCPTVFTGNPTSLDRIVRLPELLQLIGVSTASLYRWIGEGCFPAAIRLGKNSVGWKASAVQAWIDSREPAGIGAGSNDEKHAAGSHTNGRSLPLRTRKTASAAGAEGSR